MMTQTSHKNVSHKEETVSSCCPVAKILYFQQVKMFSYFFQVNKPMNVVLVLAFPKHGCKSTHRCAFNSFCHPCGVHWTFCCGAGLHACRSIHVSHFPFAIFAHSFRLIDYYLLLPCLLLFLLLHCNAYVKQSQFEHHLLFKMCILIHLTCDLKHHIFLISFQRTHSAYIPVTNNFVCSPPSHFGGFQNSSLFHTLN